MLFLKKGCVLYDTIDILSDGGMCVYDFMIKTD